jgi:hypothetical protein
LYTGGVMNPYPPSRGEHKEDKDDKKDDDDD